MTPPSGPAHTSVPPDHLGELLKHEEKLIRDELVRSESKAGSVLNAAGILLPVLTGIIAAALVVRIPLSVTLAGAASGGADALAVVLALLTVRPRMGHEPAGWIRFADQPPATVLELLAAGHHDHAEQARQVSRLAGLARHKFRRAAAAVWLMIAAVALLGASGGLALVLLALA